MTDSNRVAVIGLGAIGMALVRHLRPNPAEPSIGAALCRHAPRLQAFPHVRHLRSVAELIDWRPSLVVECAGHAAVAQYGPTLLEAGIDTIVASVGALAESSLLEALQTAAEEGQAELIPVSGAIGGLDALRAARQGGLDSVTYIGRKPPRAWIGTPAAEKNDLDTLDAATVIFEGTAREAAMLYPKNANVCAAVALAGAGFEKTRVRLVADPAAPLNVHELNAAGSFGRFAFRIENEALPDNPKTSYLAALSIEQAIRSHFQRVKT